MRIASRLVLLGLLAGCAAAPAPREPTTPLGQRQLGIFANFLPGTWDSIAQRRGPGEGTRLRIARLWPEREAQGEYWSYWEYVEATDDARPFRQRIYRFTEASGRIRGDAFRLPGDAASWAGEWRKERPFAGVAPDRLEPFAGCRVNVGAMHLSIFTGGTDGKGCRGDRPGVAYERSELRLTSSSMRNLEAGYDAAGRQVAGAAGFWELRRNSNVPR